MKMVDTRAYVGMLKELVEQGREVRMVISGSSMAPFLIHGRDSIFFRAPERELRKGDIVFYERPGGQFVVHRICRVHADGYDMIGDAQTEIEHHVQREQMFARVTKVERKGKILVPGTFWWEFFAQVWIRIIPLRPVLMHGYARFFSVDKRKKEANSVENDACRKPSLWKKQETSGGIPSARRENERKRR